MPKASVAKTKSVPKRLLIFLPLLALSLIVIAWFRSQAVSHEVCTVRLDGQCLALEVARTAEQRVVGLSGRDELAGGLLFVYDRPQRVCIWMKAMKFPIDIVWVGPDKRVSRIESSVVPETYPETFCQDNTSYVIELNSGVAARAGLQTGEYLQL